MKYISFLKQRNVFYSFNLDLLILPSKGGKLLLASYDVVSSEFALANFGSTVVLPTFVFVEDEKDKGIIIIDASVFREIIFRIEGTVINRYVFSHSLATIYPPNSGPFIPYFNHKVGFLYTIFPQINAYSIIRYKKKKFSNIVSGIVSYSFAGIKGIVGMSKPNVGHEIYLYNNDNITVLKTKKGVTPNPPSKIQAPKTEIKKEVKKEDKKEEKKKKKKNKNQQESLVSNIAQEAVFNSTPQFVTKSILNPVQVIESVPKEEIVVPVDSEMSVKEIVKREVEDGIKTVVIPIIETHMKYFEEEFKDMVKREVCTLKQNVEQETVKVESTAKIFKALIERTVEINAKFADSIEKQMKELTASAIKNKSYTIPPQPNKDPSERHYPTKHELSYNNSYPGTNIKYSNEIHIPSIQSEYYIKEPNDYIPKSTSIDFEGLNHERMGSSAKVSLSKGYPTNYQSFIVPNVGDI